MQSKVACYDAMVLACTTAASDRPCGQKAFINDVGKESWESRRGFDTCPLSGVKIRRSGSRMYVFPKQSLSQSAFRLFPLETLLSILHDLRSSSSAP